MFPQHDALHLPIVLICTIALGYFVIRGRSFTGVVVSVAAMCFGESLVSTEHTWLFLPSAVLLSCAAALVALRLLSRYRLVRRRPMGDRGLRWW